MADKKDLPWYVWASPVGLAAAGVAAATSDEQRADLKAIKEYVTNQRPKIRQFPMIQAAIESFEQWYEGLTWYDLNVKIEDKLAEARRRKYEIDKMTQSLPDPTTVPADAYKGYARVPAPIAQPDKPMIPLGWKIGGAVGLGLIATILGSVFIFRKTNPVARML